MRHTAFLIKLRCITVEMEEAFRLVQSRMQKIDEDRDKEVMRIMRKPASTKLTAPLANPVSDPSLEEIMEVFQGINSGGRPPLEDMQKLIERRRAIMPEDARDVINRSEKEYNTLTETFDKILQKADGIKDGIWADQEEWLQCEYMPAVAEDAFRAIVNGDDDIFKLKIGRYIWQDFMSQSNIPLPVLHFEELEDEEEWDFIGTEGNGKLGLKIYDEDDLMEVKTDSVNGMENVTLPLSSVLTQYAGMPVEPHLYIRKSHIKVFKDAGFSDRKARDYAVILGTLAGVNKQATGGYEFGYENLFDLGKNGTGEERIERTQTEKTQTERTHAEEITEASRVEEQLRETNSVDGKIREELERKLKQAQKENQSCRHEISVLQREIERLRHQLTERKVPEEEETGEVSLEEEEIEYPYHTKLKVVVYGGFEAFHRELQKLLPDVRIVETSAHIDVNPIRNADIVFLQINKTDHSGYWTVCDACRNAKVPYIHLNYASARRCADVMVGEIKKKEK